MELAACEQMQGSGVCGVQANIFAPA